jgi:hypothetical protein
MVEDYTAVFGGRDAELAQLDAFLAQERYPFLLRRPCAASLLTDASLQGRKPTSLWTLTI